MTKDKDFKRRVRERMRKTGESYTAARAQLLATDPSTSPADPPSTSPEPDPPPTSPLPEDYADLAGMSDEAVSSKTGRDWPGWVRWLDDQGAADLPHSDIARRVNDVLDHGWWSQTVTVGYERIRGLRETGQRRDGSYEANRSRTLPVAAETLYAWVEDPDRRSRWLPEPVETRTTRPPRSVRFTWSDDTLVECYVQPKGEAKSALQVQHSKLPDQAARESMKAYWGERLDALQELIG